MKRMCLFSSFWQHFFMTSELLCTSLIASNQFSNLWSRPTLIDEAMKIICVDSTNVNIVKVMRMIERIGSPGWFSQKTCEGASEKNRHRATEKATQKRDGSREKKQKQKQKQRERKKKKTQTDRYFPHFLFLARQEQQEKSVVLPVNDRLTQKASFFRLRLLLHRRGTEAEKSFLHLNNDRFYHLNRFVSRNPHPSLSSPSCGVSV